MKGFLVNVLKINIFLFLMISFFSSFLFAEKVEITSDSMNAENMKKEVHFIGNVLIKQTKNWLHGDTVIVYFDENNETNKYEAIGSVTFEFKKENSFYKGSANKITYFPAKSQYILLGHAIIDDQIYKRHVNGDEIVFDMLTGNANVKGSRKNQ